MVFPGAALRCVREQHMVHGQQEVTEQRGQGVMWNHLLGSPSQTHTLECVEGPAAPGTTHIHPNLELE